MNHNFLKDLEILINKSGKDSETNTPDFILAEFMNECLYAYKTAHNKTKGIQATENFPRTIHDVLLYCHPHMEQMWASSIVGIIFYCDFRDAKPRLDEYLEFRRKGFHKL